MARCCCVLTGHEDCPHEPERQCNEEPGYKCRCNEDQLPDSPVCEKCLRHLDDPGFTILKVVA